MLCVTAVRWLPGTVGASGPPGARVFDRDRLGHREDLAGGRYEQGLRHAVGPSLPGKGVFFVVVGFAIAVEVVRTNLSFDVVRWS